MDATTRILGEISRYCQEMIKTSSDFREFFNNSVSQFKNMTAEQGKYMIWEGGLTIGSAVIGAGCGVVGAFGTDGVKSVGEVASKFFDNGSRAINPLLRNPQNMAAAHCEITRNNYQTLSGEIGVYGQAPDKAQQSMMNILQAKARGG